MPSRDGLVLRGPVSQWHVPQPHRERVAGRLQPVSRRPLLCGNRPRSAHGQLRRWILLHAGRHDADACNWRHWRRLSLGVLVWQRVGRPDNMPRRDVLGRPRQHAALPVRSVHAGDAVPDARPLGSVAGVPGRLVSGGGGGAGAGKCKIGVVFLCVTLLARARPLLQLLPCRDRHFNSAMSRWLVLPGRIRSSAAMRCRIVCKCVRRAPVHALSTRYILWARRCLTASVSGGWKGSQPWGNGWV